MRVSGLTEPRRDASTFQPPRLRLAASGEAAPTVSAGEAHVWRSADADPIAYGFRRDGRYWMHWPGLATYRFAPDDPFITAYPHPDALAENIVDVYARTVLPMALHSIGFEALHASAIADARGLVLFAGPSQAGKSTIAFGLSQRGYMQWSDDSLVFGRNESAFTALPLPFAVRLRTPSLDLFDLGEPPGIFLRQMAPCDGRGESIRAICLISRSDATCAAQSASIRRVLATEAFASVLLHAHEFDPADSRRRRRLLETYLEVAARVPVFEVVFRPGRDHIDAVLDAIIEDVAMSRPRP